MKFKLMKKNNNLINESKEDIYTDIGHNIDSYIDDENVYGSIVWMFSPITIVDNCEQNENAEWPIEVTVFGMVMFVNSAQP